MSDVFAVAELLIDHLKKNHGDEVDLVAYYGSYAQGVAAEHSDLDFFYVPAAGCNPPIARCFLLDGRLFDFWPLSWQTLAGFATGTLRCWAFAPALVYHAQVLYARSDEAVERLGGLKGQVSALQQEGAKAQMLERALERFVEAQAHMEELHQGLDRGGLAAVRCASWQIIEGLWETLALANQVFFDRGFHQSLAQVQRFEHRPADMGTLLETAATSPMSAEVVAATEALTRGTRQVLMRLQKSLPSSSIGDVFDGAYPELKDALGKVLALCGAGERVAALAAAWSVQREVDELLASTRYSAVDMRFNRHDEVTAAFRSLALPNLLADESLELDVLATAIEHMDKALRELLSRNGVALNEFADLSELKKAL